MPKIKVLSGGGFPEREVNSNTVGSLRDEDAENVVNNKEATYAPKSAWKELRDQETDNKEAIDAKNQST